MSTLVVFLEEPSAEWMIKSVLPKVLPSDCELKCIHFEGKRDLEKNLERKLRCWQKPDTRFLVMRDRDSEDCRAVKRRLAEICSRAGHPETVVRIACGELESFFTLGTWRQLPKLWDASCRQARKQNCGIRMR